MSWGPPKATPEKLDGNLNYSKRDPKKKKKGMPPDKTIKQGQHMRPRARPIYILIGATRALHLVVARDSAAPKFLYLLFRGTNPRRDQLCPRVMCPHSP